MVGCGSMGGAMALLFSSHGIEVSIIDKTEDNVKTVLKNAQSESLSSKVKAHDTYESLCKSLQSSSAPKVFVFSLPHGGSGDSVIAELAPFLERGDIILDGANENFVVTERRQGELNARGVYYLGTGVSGGYQSARHGPSISMGGDVYAME
jgi:6-phosphogluconate dehydrogenase